MVVAGVEAVIVVNVLATDDASSNLTVGSGCVAQLVERLLPIPEACHSNAVISKNLFILNICLLSALY